MKYKILPTYKFKKMSNFEIDDFESIFSVSNQGVWQWDLSNNIIYFSKMCIEMFGYNENTYMNLISSLNISIKETFIKILNNSIKNNKDQFSCECKVLRPDKSYTWVQCYCKIFYNSDNIPVKLTSCILDITEKKHWQDKIYNIAYYDNLTKLPNGNMLKRDLKVLCSQGNKFFLIFMDIDDFKIINDTLGHDIGDLFLNKVSKILKKFQDENCKVYRYSGDEFIFILKDIHHKYALQTFIENLYRVLNDHIFAVEGMPIYINTTIGVSIFPDHTNDMNKLLNYASSAMYYAKSHSKNNYTIYSDIVSSKTLEDAKLENSLKLALKNNELDVFYQPQVNISNNKLIGVEALVRWIKPDGTIIMPSNFIPTAEKTGLIVKLGEFVLKKACSQMKLWHKKIPYPLKLSVNVAEKQLEEVNFINTVQGILSETGFDPKFLELEITESTAIRDIKKVVTLLKSLKDINIKIALDDFGTGYSSLNYLKDLPLNTIKIDKCFMDDIENDYKKKAIIKSIIILSHDINLNIICEGVETEKQLNFLKSINCDEVQGYYFGKPLDVLNFEKSFL